MRAWKKYAIAGLASAAAALGLAVPAEAAEPAFQLPFPCGQTWHGNNPDSSAHVTPWEIDFNRGDDLGSPVLASAAGTVATAANQGSANGYGNLVKISHGSSGYFSYYAHLRDMTVSAGDTVTQGQLIGHVGNTSKPGNAIQPHLHYEVRYGSPYPDNIQPAVFAGVRFPYPAGDVTSKNCGGGQHSAAKSINGDAYDDAVGVDADGVATMYPGTSGGGFGTGIRMGAGWSGFTRIGVADSNADGWADLFAIKAGTLYYWNNHGDGTFTSAVEVGPGWSGFEWVLYADVNGDGKADILARDGGNMYLYPGLGGGTFAARSLVSAGWASLLRQTAADADGDGDADIWATNAAGELYFWKRSPSGYATAVQVGTGWNAYRQLVSLDINGDGKADLVAIKTSDNTLWQWLGTGTGTFGQSTPIGTGWAGHTLADS
ncbi:VCBS repeat domain-containing M23 family metallopeptidase [Amycolatopsis sp. NBC_01480]|uniref:VCBS repeat domain-containing M23 family metallopeptidase n=1 Tax=Amycolatopsis sp. NBC_01480 TaxID=2903562 RepID=UPI002E27C85B|nr:VCBS repeat domain-containing M23 family metallopeptidase [Amycolatopsis sp. NBC_01480]